MRKYNSNSSHRYHGEERVRGRTSDETPPLSGGETTAVRRRDFFRLLSVYRGGGVVVAKTWRVTRCAQGDRSRWREKSARELRVKREKDNSNLRGGRAGYIVKTASERTARVCVCVLYT